MKKSLAALYWNLPEPCKDLLGAGLRRVPRFQVRPGTEEVAYHTELQKTQGWSAEQLRELQSERLHDLMVHCHEHVPYYRDLMLERDLRPADFTQPEDLAKLPLLTKDIIRKAPRCFLSTAPDQGRRITVSTGGSTGTPMEFVFDARMDGVRRAHWWRWSDMAGVDLYRDRMVYCGGIPYQGGRRAVVDRGVLSPTRDRLHLGTTKMTDAVLDRFLKDLRRFGADYMRGYASGCYLLARRLLDRGETYPLKAVLTSSDTLYPQYREAMTEAFGCGVFDHYGQNEDSLTANECVAHTGMHINVESCIPETVDDAGESVQAGVGRLVSTHLMNTTMPLIRYAVGDRGELGPFDADCPCGRHHQKLLNLDGRDDEIIETPEGARVGCGSLNQPMKHMAGQVGASQYIQRADGGLTLRIVPGPDFQKDATCAALARAVQEHLESAIAVDVEVVDRIPTRPNGKFQFIVRES